MNEWQVVYTEQAEQDLREVYEYIAFSLLEPEIAKSQARRIIEAVAKLDHLPLRHQLVGKEPWRSKGLRVLTVDNYLAFYLPIEAQSTVAVIRIMYGGRNIDEQLSSERISDDVAELREKLLEAETQLANGVQPLSCDEVFGTLMHKHSLNE